MTVKSKLIPVLRFPEFEGEWDKALYEDIYDFKITNSFSRENLNYDNGTVKNIHYGDIHTKFNSLFDITKENVPFINNNIDISRIPKDCYLQEGDLVVADASEDYNDIGKTIEIQNLNNEKVIAGLHTFLARKESDKMANVFASFLMKTYKIRLKIMKIAQGTKVLGISKSRLAKISIFLPHPTEQTKIATFLTAVDKRISLLQKKKEKLTQYKKGVMQKIFSQEIRFKPALSEVEGDDDGKDFAEWEEKKLGEVADCLDNDRKPLNDSERQKMQGNIPYWGANNIMDYVNDYLFDETIVLLAEDGGNFNEFKDRPIANISYGKCWVNNHTHVLRGTIKIINEFLFYSLVHKNITGSVSGGTRAKLTKNEMLKIKMSVPSVPEQKKIANFLSSIDKSIENISTQIDGSVKFKQGLLQRMFV